MKKINLPEAYGVNKNLNLFVSIKSGIPGTLIYYLALSYKKGDSYGLGIMCTDKV